MKNSVYFSLKCKNTHNFFEDHCLQNSAGCLYIKRNSIQVCVVVKHVYQHLCILQKILYTAQLGIQWRHSLITITFNVCYVSRKSFIFIHGVCRCKIISLIKLIYNPESVAPFQSVVNMVKSVNKWLKYC